MMEPPAKMLKKTITKFSKDGGKKEKKTMMVHHAARRDCDVKSTAIVPALRGNELMQSVALPKLTKDELPELCLFKIISVDEIELSNGGGNNRRKHNNNNAGESAMSLTLKPMVAEIGSGEIVRHTDEPDMDGPSFAGFNDEDIPEVFTIWASKAHKALILSGRWVNPEKCYLYISPAVNRYHAVNTFRGNISLNYRIYTPLDLNDIMIDNDVSEFDKNNRQHLAIIADEMIKESKRPFHQTGLPVCGTTSRKTCQEMPTCCNEYSNYRL